MANGDAARAEKDAATQALAPTLQDASEGLAVPAAASVNQHIGRFVVLRSLGSGGMGTVYAAYDERLDRKVAVKLLHNVAPDAAGRHARVLREAQAMARVSHPNVVQVFEVGEFDEQIFIAMEFIDGVTLRSWQQGYTRSWKEILGVYLDAGQGLLAAHRAGLVHRDFKPDNVLVDAAGRPRVLDFGLAHVQRDESSANAADARLAQPTQSAVGPSLTLEGVIAGTPGYMSPEQFQGTRTDHRSDQFSFCIALYEALYHLRPFAGVDFASQAAEVIAGRLIPPPQESEVPLEVWRALERGMAHDPQQRFPSLAELLTALAVDIERDPAGRWQLRRRIATMAVLVASCMATVQILTHLRRPMTISELARSAAVASACVTSALLFLRRPLSRNAFHYDLVKHVAVNVLQLAAVRIAAWKIGLPIEHYAPLDLLILAGLVASLAVRYFASLWWVVVLLVFGAMLTLARQDTILWVFAAAFSLVPSSVAYCWSRVAQASRSVQPPISSSSS